jgi:hypothetical protein
LLVIENTKQNKKQKERKKEEITIRLISLPNEKSIILIKSSPISDL